MSNRLITAIRELAAARDITQVIGVVKAHAREISGADGVTFVLRERECCYYAEEDAIGPLWKGRRFPLSACISGWAMLNKQATAIADIYADARIPHDAYRPTFVKSLAMVPVRTSDPLAAIGAYWAQQHTVTPDELERLQALADSTAVALANVQTYAELQHALRQAEEARDVAVGAGRAKDEFLAVISHELRTPLNAMLGWITMIRNGVLNAEQVKRGTETIERNTRLQAQLIDDLLDTSRIATGKLHLDLRPVSFETVVRSAVDSIRPAANAKRVTLSLEVRPSVKGLIRGDPARLQQVAYNLLSNAMKFTPADGKVNVQAEFVDGMAEIAVTDTGVGIDPEFLPHLFERFRQEDSSKSRRFMGLGLGLSLVRDLVELHGGTVSASSAGKGKGATFVARFPIVDAQPQQEEQPAPADAGVLGGVHVLLIEDDADTRDLVRIVLESSGARVLATDSAEEATKALGALRPSILVCDIGLPGQNGYEFIRQLRRLPAREGGDIPAIAVTAYAKVEDRQAALNAGFQAHVPKPIMPEDLVALVRSHAAQTHSEVSVN
ncbi:MAG TPA: ATP-binding protein [Planctomycetota bacterium]|jgi:two-component system CheB/CheR fusion protein